MWSFFILCCVIPDYTIAWFSEGIIHYTIKFIVVNDASFHYLTYFY